MEHTVELEKEALAKASKFFPILEKFGLNLKEFFEGYKDLRANVVILMNEKNFLASEVRKVAIEKAKIEEEAKIRIESMNKGHAAMVDRLSKREMELAGKLKDVELREAISVQKNKELELLKSEYEIRLKGVTDTVTAGKK